MKLSVGLVSRGLTLTVQTYSGVDFTHTLVHTWLSNCLIHVYDLRVSLKLFCDTKVNIEPLTFQMP